MTTTHSRNESSIPNEEQRGPDFATASVVLGVAGFLPVLPLIGSIGALVCGYLALRRTDRGRRTQARAGIVLGWVGVAAPLVALFVYCVLLGYPFPIHRYRPDR